MFSFVIAERSINHPSSGCSHRTCIPMVQKTLIKTNCVADAPQFHPQALLGQKCKPKPWRKHISYYIFTKPLNYLNWYSDIQIHNSCGTSSKTVQIYTILIVAGQFFLPFLCHRSMDGSPLAPLLGSPAVSVSVVSSVPSPSASSPASSSAT